MDFGEVIPIAGIRVGFEYDRKLHRAFGGNLLWSLYEQWVDTTSGHFHSSEPAVNNCRCIYF